MKHSNHQPHMTSRGRTWLWPLLVVSATCDVVASAANLMLVGVVCGLVTLGFGAALVLHHYRARAVGGRRSS